MEELTRVFLYFFPKFHYLSDNIYDPEILAGAELWFRGVRGAFSRGAGHQQSAHSFVRNP